MTFIVLVIYVTSITLFLGNESFHDCFNIGIKHQLCYSMNMVLEP